MDLNRPYFWSGIGFTALTIAPIIIFGLVGWPGEYEACLQQADGNCYCECVDRDAIKAAFKAGRVVEGGVSDAVIENEFLLSDGLVAQPFSTWSNIVPAIIGLIILWYLGNAYYPLSYAGMNNPMMLATVCSAIFGFVVIFQGTGSMYLHAALREWGGWTDNLSMNLFVSLMLLYNISRIAKMESNWLFVTIFFAANIALGILVLPGLLPGAIVFAVLIAVAILLELIIIYQKFFAKVPILGVLTRSMGHIHREQGWFWGGIGFFAAAIALWLPSWDGGWLCDPRGAIQPHGFWHAFSGFASASLYLHFRTETQPAVPAGAAA